MGEKLETTTTTTALAPPECIFELRKKAASATFGALRKGLKESRSRNRMMDPDMVVIYFVAGLLQVPSKGQRSKVIHSIATALTTADATTCGQVIAALSKMPKATKKEKKAARGRERSRSNSCRPLGIISRSPSPSVYRLPGVSPVRKPMKKRVNKRK